MCMEPGRYHISPLCLHLHQILALSSRLPRPDLLLGQQESGMLRGRRTRTYRGHERRSERSLQDRYNGVVQHWTELSPVQRRRLLSVPMQSMLEGTSLSALKDASGT